jgi:hypothetical protein
MSKIKFTKEQIEELRANPNVKQVSELGITYTDAFKMHFLEEYHSGKRIWEIFESCGFDIKTIGNKRIKDSRERWCRAENRLKGIQDTRKDNPGRPRIRDLSPEENIKRLKAENEYLKQVINFQQELTRLERQVEKEYRLSRKRNSQ